MTATATDIDRLAIDTIRTLSMDAVEAAKSGHPGTPMALAPVAYTVWKDFLRYDPADPAWPNRDRFVLSCGHASMLLYALIHLAGLAERHLIVSFAPYTPLLALLKGIGQLFPGPSKTTRAYTLREEGIVKAAAAAGFRPVRRSLNQAPFYFSRLIAFERG